MKIDTEGRRELFRARTGSHNYNLNDETSDEDWKVFVLPSFEDLYDGTQYSSQTHTSEELDYSVKDIRFFGKQIWKANITFLEVLYSDKIIFSEGISEETKILLDKIFAMREELVTCNLPVMYEACVGMHKQRVKAMSKGSVSTKHLIEKYGYCTKNAMHSYRYLDFLCRFSTGRDFEKALKYEPNTLKDYILGIKKGVLGDESQAKGMLERNWKVVEQLVKPKYKSQESKYETIEKLNVIIKEIVRINQ